MRLWTWALQAYARPGVPEACLDLQDRFGQCVPYLLWAGWAAGQGRLLLPETLKAGAGVSDRWQQAAVAPLRAARRAMKASVTGVEDAAREALRDQVKALELQAERLLMEALEALAPEARGRPSPLLPALSDAASAWPSEAPLDALSRLVQTLS